MNDCPHLSRIAWGDGTVRCKNCGAITTDKRHLSDAELDKLIKAGDVTITRVIDRVIALNGIIGVGFISLADSVSDYIREQGREWARKHSKLTRED